MEQTSLSGLVELSKELNNLLEQGKTLSEISKYTYEQRESGRNIPYFSVLNKQGNKVTAIVASPTAKQKELKEFFENFYPMEKRASRGVIMYMDLEENDGRVILRGCCRNKKDVYIY